MKKILLSIKPKYVNKIFSGEKKVEYRKNVVPDVELVYIYATVPIKKIVAEFKVNKVLCGTPNELWIETKDIGGIDFKDYCEYFARRDKAYAYIISNLQIYDTPLLLSDLGIKRPPQNYQYI